MAMPAVFLANITLRLEPNYWRNPKDLPGIQMHHVPFLRDEYGNAMTLADGQ